MAGKYDKESGIFLIENTISRFIYIGKSTGVGVAIRSAKSKLKNGVFHNKVILRAGESVDSLVFKEPILDEHNVGLRNIFSRTKDKYLNAGWLIANDIEVVNFEEPLEDLTDLQLDLVNRLTVGFKSGKIIGSEFDQYLKKLKA